MSGSTGGVSRGLGKGRDLQDGVLNPTVLEGLDMLHATCAPACTLFDLPDIHVLTIERHQSLFTVVVETVPSLVGAPLLRGARDRPRPMEGAAPRPSLRRSARARGSGASAATAAGRRRAR